MYIYIFGSLCRGEIDEYSDVDLLIIKDEIENLQNFDIEKYSIYSKERIRDLWEEGNPFAWHLYLESKLIFSDNDIDFLKQLGEPKDYISLEKDLKKFYKLFDDSCQSINKSDNSVDFDFSMIFLAIRNFASCYSLGTLKKYNFSRNSCLNLGENSISISKNCYSILEKSRILSTRGIGNNLSKEDIKLVVSELNIITDWFHKLLK